MLDGEENPYAVIRDRNFDQVQKYVADTGHFFDFIVVVANKRKLEGLDPKLRKVVADAMTKAVAAQRSMAADEDAKALADLRGRGMQFDAVSPEFRAEMRKASASVVDGVKSKIGAELVDQVLQQAR